MRPLVSKPEERVVAASLRLIFPGAEKIDRCNERSLRVTMGETKLVEGSLPRPLG